MVHDVTLILVMHERDVLQKGSGDFERAVWGFHIEPDENTT